MIYKKILMLLSFLVLLIGCSRGYNFMGAVGMSLLKGMYVERLYENPKYPIDKLPTGTAYYGFLRENRDKFIVKYYIYDNKEQTIEIPKRDMRKVRRKDYLYRKTSDNRYVKSTYAPGGLYNLSLIPIKECYANGWCKLYPTDYAKDLYYKRKNIY